MPDRASINAGPRVELLYCFCRLQMPAIDLPREKCQQHLERTFALFQKKSERSVSWEAYLDTLYPLDWFLASACLEGNRQAWEQLFASRAGRSDCLLMDALRARAARLYPRDEERQDTAVTDFWGHLCVAETPGSLPVLARFDGQRPLVTWLIRVFHNWHISQLRKHPLAQALPDDDLAMPMPNGSGEIEPRPVPAPPRDAMNCLKSSCKSSVSALRLAANHSSAGSKRFQSFNLTARFTSRHFG